MVYLLIKGPSYRGLDFDARETVREGVRKQLETHGIRFVNTVGCGMKRTDASLWSGNMPIRTMLPCGEMHWKPWGLKSASVPTYQEMNHEKEMRK